jgi:putative CRISPR-associated protein (TIGR02620 family)
MKNNTNNINTIKPQKIIIASRHKDTISLVIEVIQQSQWFHQQCMIENHENFQIESIESPETTIVIGNLPVNIISDICKINAHYMHIDLTIPRENRGKELTIEELKQFQLNLQPYYVIKSDDYINKCNNVNNIN